MPNPKPRTKFWAWALGPDLPNKQEMLFWLDKKGPHFVFFLVRQMVLMLSIYLAVIVMHIGPVAIETFFGENAIPVKVIGCAYLLMTFYPLRGLQTYMPVIIRRAVHVSNIEMMKNHDVIEAVLQAMRSQKDERVKRLLDAMQDWVVSEAVKKEANSNADYKSLIDKEKYEDIHKTILMIEPSGELDAGGLKQLMQAMGHGQISLKEAEKKVIDLDDDNSGTVSEQEYILWMAQQVKPPASSIELVKAFFGTLTEPGKDSVKTEVMQDMFQKFGLSDEDIYSLMEDLDDDKSGDITLEEAAHFIEKYAN
jgi:Ca2+-binding EF-hand superfamily protein